MDLWDVPEDIHAALRDRYYRLANLELGLERFKRAAYIFANLLGDHSAAANVLVQGGHFAEAAKLLELELNELQQAADCYEKAGLLVDALRLKTQLQLWEDVARIHTLMGNFEEARNAYRKAVDELERRHDYLGASRILQDHLHDPEAAFQSRFRAWPVSHQSWECLELAFGYLGQQGRHAETRETLRQITANPTFQQGLQKPLSFLVTLSKFYPDLETRKMIAREAVHHGSRLLQRQALTATELHPVLSTLQSLWPADVLFARDGRRFQLQRRSAHVEQKRQQRVLKLNPSPGPGPILQGQIQMHPDTVWHYVLSLGDAILAIGCSRRELRFSFRDWTELNETLSVPIPPEEIEAVPQALLIANWKRSVLIQRKWESKNLKIPPEFRAFCARHCRLQMKDEEGQSPYTLAMAAEPEHFWQIVVLENGHGVTLRYDHSNQLNYRFPFHGLKYQYPERRDPFGPRLLPSKDGMLALVRGYLYRFGSGEFEPCMELGAMDVVAVSPPDMASRIAWSKGNTVYATVPGTKTKSESDLAFIPRHLLFLGSDRLLVSSGTEAMLLAIDEEDLVPVEKWQWPFAEIQHVVVLENPSRVGTMDRAGNACVWELPSRLFA